MPTHSWRERQPKRSGVEGLLLDERWPPEIPTASLSVGVWPEVTRKQIEVIRKGHSSFILTAISLRQGSVLSLHDGGAKERREFSYFRDIASYWASTSAATLPAPLRRLSQRLKPAGAGSACGAASACACGAPTSAPCQKKRCVNHCEVPPHALSALPNVDHARLSQCSALTPMGPRPWLS